jgi:hypothetical protein
VLQNPRANAAKQRRSKTLKNIATSVALAVGRSRSNKKPNPMELCHFNKISVSFKQKCAKNNDFSSFYDFSA